MSIFSKILSVVKGINPYIEAVAGVYSLVSGIRESRNSVNIATPNPIVYLDQNTIDSLTKNYNQEADEQTKKLLESVRGTFNARGMGDSTQLRQEEQKIYEDVANNKANYATQLKMTQIGSEQAAQKDYNEQLQKYIAEERKNQQNKLLNYANIAGKYLADNEEKNSNISTKAPAENVVNVPANAGTYKFYAPYYNDIYEKYYLNLN